MYDWFWTTLDEMETGGYFIVDFNTTEGDAVLMVSALKSVVKVV